MTGSQDHVALGLYRSVEVSVVTGVHGHGALGVFDSVEVSVVTGSHERVTLRV